jgi:hypothetical protein
MKRILVAVFLLSGCSVFAQYQDNQLWENISLDKQLTRLLEATFNHEGRISENISQYHFAYGDVGLRYLLSRHLAVGANYVFAWKRARDRDNYRHQWYGALYYKTKLSDQLTFFWRAMFQEQVEDVFSSDAGRIPENYVRNKFTLKYHPGHKPWKAFTPYCATELFYQASHNTKYGPQFDRTRWFLGTFYDLNKKNALEAYWLIEQNYHVNNPATNFVEGIGFSHSF